jgi:hypothetical protein
VCLAAPDWEFPRWTTSLNVKLLLPPRQSRGPPLVARDHRGQIEAVVEPVLELGEAHQSPKRSKSSDWYVREGSRRAPAKESPCGE